MFSAIEAGISVGSMSSSTPPSPRQFDTHQSRFFEPKLDAAKTASARGQDLAPAFRRNAKNTCNPFPRQAIAPPNTSRAEFGRSFQCPNMSRAELGKSFPGSNISRAEFRQSCPSPNMSRGDSARLSRVQTGHARNSARLSQVQTCPARTRESFSQLQTCPARTSERVPIVHAGPAWRSERASEGPNASCMELRQRGPPAPLIPPLSNQQNSSKKFPDRSQPSIPPTQVWRPEPPQARLRSRKLTSATALRSTAA
jgi:hypothetical protein